MRMDRFLHSLRAVTDDRHHPFHQMFLDRDAELGYQLAPFLIWTSQWYRPPSPMAAVAATDDDATVQESDDDANSLLWEDRWQAVMAETDRCCEEALSAFLRGRSTEHSHSGTKALTSDSGRRMAALCWPARPTRSCARGT